MVEQIPDKLQKGFTFYTDQLKADGLSDQIMSCLQNFGEELEIYQKWHLTQDNINAEYIFAYDYPQYNWCFEQGIETQTINEKISKVNLMFRYNQYSKQQINDYQQKLDEAFNQFFIQKIQGRKLSTIEKLKAAHDYLIENTYYTKINGSSDYPTSQDIIGSLVNYKCVCTGYAAGFKYLCDRLGGLQVIVVSGQTTEPHAWNMAKVDGEFYHIDVTWDDQKNHGTKEPSYFYFMLPDFMLLSKRTIDIQGVPKSGKSLKYVQMFQNGIYNVIRKQDLKSTDTEGIMALMLQKTKLSLNDFKNNEVNLLYAFDFQNDSKSLIDSIQNDLIMQLSFKVGFFIISEQVNYTEGADIVFTVKLQKKKLVKGFPSKGPLDSDTAYVFDLEKQIKEEIEEEGLNKYSSFQNTTIDKYFIIFSSE